jgi:adenylate cyclase
VLSERPAVIVRCRLEHAGYEPIDGLENLGADELQFLSRFVFKSERLGDDQVGHLFAK